MDASKLWNMRNPFSWSVFTAFVAGILAVILPFIWRLVRGPGFRPNDGRQVLTGFLPEIREPPVFGERGRGRDGPRAKRRFPWFGWCGVVLGAVSWLLAWNRFEWFAPLQAHTFLPLWIAYILVMNALCVWRTGRCLMTSHLGPYAMLFPVSAAFWWFFEYLNRYVWNWNYRGVEGMSAAEYVFFATFSFSTVLPAVTATAEWLASFRPFSDGRLRGFWRVDIRRPAGVMSLAAVAAGGLSGIVFWPQFAFPFLWVSPLAVFLAVQLLRGEPTVFDCLRLGDWRLVVRFAMAALICGVFWELWNDHSLAKWVYALPYVHAFTLFEMPAVGYSGYLPFGLECAAVAAWVLPALAGHQTDILNEEMK